MKLDDLICKENIDVEEYYNYFINVKNEMENPDWLGDLEKEDFKYLISRGAKSWTYFYKDEFVCSFMHIVATKKAIEHLGLNYKDEECAECGPMFVKKEYRGNKLQAQMFKKLEDFCKQQGFKYILTTANPNNIYSSNNMAASGYEKVGFKLLERGPRNIYVRKIDN